MAKMFLEDNNAGREILITDEQGKWWYAPSGWTYGDADLYPHAETNEEEINIVIDNLRREIANGTTYSAQDFIDDMNDEESAERIVEQYSGAMTIDEIDNYVNYTYNTFGDHVRIGHDESCWYEI